MTQHRQALEFDLDDFTPRAPAADTPAVQLPDRKAVEKVASFPSREAPDDDQLNIKGPKAMLDRFRALRKSERYKYADLLEFMMDAYEDQRRKDRQ
jgi:hypothetical protein